MSDWGQRIALASIFSILLGQPVLAQERTKERSSVEIRRVSQLENVSTRAADLLVQQPTPPLPPSQRRTQGGQESQIVFITEVQIQPTETGIEIILVTSESENLEIKTSTQGNAYIAEILNAQLKLPDDKPFIQEKPIQGIAQVRVANNNANAIQVTVTGQTNPPTVELFDSEEGLIFSSTPTVPSAQKPPQTPTDSPPEHRGELEGGQAIPVTDVQLNPTETGIELLLQTPPQSAEQLQPNNISSGNNFIADIPNAQLQLPDGKPFRAEEPIEGISEITVNNQDASTIRVTALGETALPQVELFDSDSGLIFGFTPPPPLPLTRGEQEGGQTVTIDRVQLNPTETGFEILLLTPTGTPQQLRVVNVSQGNNFIAEIPNAQINLSDGQPFRSENPIEGVSEVTVTNQNENTVLVTVVGEEEQPTVELFDSEEGLIFSAIGDEQTAQEEDIELVVTGEQDGYRVPNASTATRTDTRYSPINSNCAPGSIARSEC
jgi:iron complex outermembrane recepter protein